MKVTIAQDSTGLQYVVRTTDPLDIQGAVQVREGIYVVPVTHRNAEYLQFLGADMVGIEPIRYTQLPKVDGEYELFDRQVHTAAFISLNRNCMVLNTQQTGKTAATAAACDYWHKQGEIKAVLVIPPLTTIGATWIPNMKGLLPHAYLVPIRDAEAEHMITTFGPRRTKRKVKPQRDALTVLREARKRGALLPTQFTMYFINPDKLRSDPAVLDELIFMVQSGEIGALVFDESTNFGRHDAGRTKCAIQLRSANPKLRTVLLTATPGGPDKVYSQAKLCDPFKCNIEHARWQQLTQYKLDTGMKNPGGHAIPKYIPRPEWAETVKKYLPPAILFTNEGMYDFKEVFHEVEVKLSEEQLTIYNKIIAEAVLPYVNADKKHAVQDIKHIMTEIAKTLQVSVGTVITEGSVSMLDYTPRLDALKKIIASTENKVIIFNTYIESCGRLASDLNDEGINAVVVTGQVTGRKRTEVLQEFKTGAARVLVCHPKTVAHGIELTCADTIIFNGPVVCGVEYFNQGYKRGSSFKQKSDVINIYKLAASPIENKYWESMEKNLALEEVFLDMIKAGGVNA